MASPFLGEIRMFGGNFAPRGNAFCDGQLIPISQNTALFSILGTTYGGNGQTTFALPSLQGRAPMHFGQGPGLTARSLGEMAGSPTVTLISTEMPAHSHAPTARAAAGNQTSPAGGTWATVLSGRNPTPLYSNAAPNVQMNPSSVGIAGGGQPHENTSPYLAITFIIATQGIFPPRN